jgi:hypothetical protein
LKDDTIRPILKRRPPGQGHKVVSLNLLRIQQDHFLDFLTNWAEWLGSPEVEYALGLRAACNDLAFRRRRVFEQGVAGESDLKGVLDQAIQGGIGRRGRADDRVQIGREERLITAGPFGCIALRGSRADPVLTRRSATKRPSNYRP